MKRSEYMDKQIMDLSKSHNSDFINLINNNNPQEDDQEEINKEKAEIGPSYDFQPIRPPTRQQSGLDSGVRVWNSADSVSPALAAARNYSSLDSIEPAKGITEKDHNASNEGLVSEIDRRMKKHVDNLMHALEGVSARISQLESRSRNLENSVDDLKVAVGNNQASTDGKLRQLENILREVQSGVQVIRDKQDIFEGQLHLSKLQESKVDHQPNSFEQTASAPLQSHHHQLLPATSLSPPSPSPPNAPPPAPQQILPPPINQNQYPPPQIDPYYLPSQPQDTTTQQYQLPPSQPPQLPQYPPAPPQYSQPPPPQHHPSLSSMNPSLQHPSLSSMNPPQQHPSLSSMNPPQQHPSLSSMNPPQHHPSLSSVGHPHNATNPSAQHFYGPPSNIYDSPSTRHGSAYSSLSEPPPYPYGGPPPQYGGGGTKQHMSASQLPTARVLPQALPTASGLGDGSGGSSGTGNRVPIDDVVDKVTHMGFSREQVRATVRKLTENGQSVDLNIVLDKLMNDGVEGQPPRGWLGR